MPISAALKREQAHTRNQVQQFTKLVPCERYKIQLVHSDKSRENPNKPRNRTYSQQTLCATRTINYLRAQNRSGYHVFIRPDDPCYVLLDLDKDASASFKRIIADGLPFAIAVESSPNKLQLWVRIGELGDVNEFEAADCARALARWYQGDPGSAKADQVGRAPGFRNRKHEYVARYSGFPEARITRRGSGESAYEHVARIRSALPPPPPRAARACADQSTATIIHSQMAPDRAEMPHEVWCGAELIVKFSEPTITSAVTAYSEVLSYMIDYEGYNPERRTDGLIDRSKQDFVICRALLMLGFSCSFVSSALEHGSDKAKTGSVDYIRRTIASVIRILE